MSGYGGNGYGGNYNQQHQYNDVQMTDAPDTSSHKKHEEESDDDEEWEWDESDLAGKGGMLDGLGGYGAVGYGNIKPKDSQTAQEQKRTFQVTRKDTNTSEKRSSTGRSKEKRKSTVMTRPLSSAEKISKKKK